MDLHSLAGMSPFWPAQSWTNKSSLWGLYFVLDGKDSTHDNHLTQSLSSGTRDFPYLLSSSHSLGHSPTCNNIPGKQKTYGLLSCILCMCYFPSVGSYSPHRPISYTSSIKDLLKPLVFTCLNIFTFKQLSCVFHGTRVLLLKAIRKCSCFTLVNQPSGNVSEFTGMSATCFRRCNSSIPTSQECFNLFPHLVPALYCSWVPGQQCHRELLSLYFATKWLLSIQTLKARYKLSQRAIGKEVIKIIMMIKLRTLPQKKMCFRWHCKSFFLT